MRKRFVSLLSSKTANFEDLILKIEKIFKVDGYHFDVMDGHFVKNFAFNTEIVKALRDKTKLIFDVHLEIEEPELFFDVFIEAGSDMITFHPQNCQNLNRALRYLKAKNILASVALDLEYPVEYIKDYLFLIDNILVLGVQPGFGRQKFNIKILEKIKALKSLLIENKINTTIGVDGGVSEENEEDLFENGADILIFGSSLLSRL
jgi:ribulose-phosphate 3-epimerase